jgi:redox-sensitive bicupin YhaK (pirin superfamily)
MNADARIFAGLFNGDESARLELNPARKAYVHLVQGKLLVQGQQLEAGDALMLEGEALLTLEHGIGAEVLVFDLQP